MPDPTICPDCHYEPPPPPRNRPPGRAVKLPGTWHYPDCPRVPQLSAKAKTKLQADLAEMDRCRARAWAAARNYVIGAGWAGGDDA